MVFLDVSVILVICSTLTLAAIDNDDLDYQFDVNKESPTLQDKLRQTLDFLGDHQTDIDNTLDNVKRGIELGGDKFWKRGHFDEDKGDAFWKRTDRATGLNSFWKRGGDSESGFWKRSPFRMGSQLGNSRSSQNSFWKRGDKAADGFWKRSDDSFWKRSKETPQLIAGNDNPEPVLVTRSGEHNRFWKRAGVPWNMLLFSKYRQMYSHPEENMLPPNTVWLGPSDDRNAGTKTVPPKNRRQGPKPNPDFNPTGW